ncbi:MAG: hypothetical protein HKN16_00155 [Saprospiraceae bacterium]|nr:hypothetical protein [Saprospiraceae bacterium]
MIRSIFLFSFMLVSSIMISQDHSAPIPYHEILEAPEDYGPGNVLARMVDGLGYRYYWASEGLRQEDLDYRPTPEAASAYETVQHIYGLASTVLNVALNKPNVRPLDFSEMDFDDLRRGALENLQKASETFRGKNAEEMSKLEVIFQRGERTSNFPLWNVMNGMLADAIYHTGQLVSFRRTTGNPMDASVNVFIGKNRN